MHKSISMESQPAVVASSQGENAMREQEKFYRTARKPHLQGFCRMKGITYDGTETRETLVLRLLEWDRGHPEDPDHLSDDEEGPTGIGSNSSNKLPELTDATPAILQSLLGALGEGATPQERAGVIQAILGVQIPAGSGIPESPRSFEQEKRRLGFKDVPTFRENETDIDTHLQIFENLMGVHGIEPADWPKYLGPSLTGRALEAYRALTPQECGVYAFIKKALLAKFQITAESYRLKFRTLNKGGTDSYQEFASQLRQACGKWLEGRQASTVEQIVNLIVVEQLMIKMAPEVREWVADRKPSTPEQAAEWADEYIANRPQWRIFSAAGGTRNPRVEKLSDKEPQVKDSNKGGPIKNITYQPPRFRVANPEPRKCYRCNQPGHVLRDCPRTRGPFPGARPAPVSVVCYPTEEYGEEVVQSDMDGMMGGVYIVDLVLGEEKATPWNMRGHLQTVIVENQQVQGLRDSGASLTLIEPDLIPASQVIPGQYVRIATAGGQQADIPVAKIHLDWGADQGIVEVGVLKGLPAKVILGNDLGQGLVTRFVQVVTRSQTRREVTQATDMVQNQPTQTMGRDHHNADGLSRREETNARLRRPSGRDNSQDSNIGIMPVSSI
ncbi:uncharacterized protein LOC134910982 [Pseudophryne corroboree]|uniref:uncharacterized protein LOC134910982 n=1 Tax=Pseudophryne corroboree TaxID=495146 RepID=UPI003081919E